MESKLSYFQDPNFRFDENSHTYTYLDPKTMKPVQIFTSVTGFISQFKEKFDSEFWAKKKAQSTGRDLKRVERNIRSCNGLGNPGP